MRAMGQRAESDAAGRAARHRLLSHPARLTIVDALSERPRGISELAEIAEIHPNTVRSHLDRLLEAGLLEVESQRRGTRGRPTKQYRLRQPLEAPDPQVELLIEAFVSLVRRTRPDSAAALAAEEGLRVGQVVGRRFAPSEAATSAWLLDLLEHFSFAPRLRHDDGHLQVDLRGCPFWGGSAEQDGEVVCSFHRGVLQGAAQAAGWDPGSVALHPFVEPRCCRVVVSPPSGSRPSSDGGQGWG